MEPPSSLPSAPVLPQGSRPAPRRIVPRSTSPGLSSSPLPPSVYSSYTASPYHPSGSFVNPMQLYHPGQGIRPHQVASMVYPGYHHMQVSTPSSVSRTPSSFPSGVEEPPTNDAVETQASVDEQGGNAASDSEHSDASIERRVLARLRSGRRKAPSSGSSKAPAPTGVTVDEVTESNGKKTKPKTKPKAVWTDAEDFIMTEVLEAKVESGGAPDNGFTPVIYNEIANRCNTEVETQKGPAKTGDMVSTRYHYLKNNLGVRG
ncbi:hypothetical protein QFC22_006730 [Naganishia vaughanmartiniae]|uniref:Uncharacterized protein n=1 Tax=Naganishia vaughanmartiniae TaxID=1424756 RepID=A0ACC2WH41_9TREE|nr:hypothetical protein QFC22_006730 [Naganishia vaughanmartiniae]